MGRRDLKTGRAGLQGKRWMRTSLAEGARSLTATVACLELDPRDSPASSDSVDVSNDDSSIDESAEVAQLALTPSSSADESETDRCP